MIASLCISGLALIDHIEVELGDGLTVLSGETGAGKTMVVEALNLAVGQRADTGLVRDGFAEARVAVSMEAAGGRRVLERRVSREGPNRCLIDGRQATAQALAEAAERLVDLHGQHEHQRLLHQRWHAEYLDAFAGDEALSARADYVAALERARRAASTLADLAAAQEDRERLQGRLTAEIADIEAAAPSVAEDEELEERLPVLRHAQQLTEAVGAARSALQAGDETGSAETGDHGALDRVRLGLEALAPVRVYDDRLEALGGQAEGALAELEDVARALADYLDGIDTDPAAHAAAEERAALLARLKERYGGEERTMRAVLEHAENARRTLADIAGGDQRRDEVARELERALGEVVAAGERLRAARSQAAPKFAEAVQTGARELAMPDARLAVDMRAVDTPGRAEDLASLPPDGLDVVEFLFSANAGEAVRPLGRVASGGELSRLMLAIKGVVGAADPVGTLVFDEIDAGIGGETATAVGAALRRLAGAHQVLVITHLPQIAAVADRNLVVEKRADGGRTTTTVRAVEGEALEVELARMLAGDTASETSREHARELLTRRRA